MVPDLGLSKLLERLDVYAGVCCIFFKKVEMGAAFSESLSKTSPKPWLRPLLTQTTYFSHSGRQQASQDISQQTPNYCLGLSIVETEERQPPDHPLSPSQGPQHCPQPVPRAAPFPCSVKPRHVSCHRAACLYLKRLAAICQQHASVSGVIPPVSALAALQV